jgi:hypothetical protein
MDSHVQELAAELETAHQQLIEAEQRVAELEDTVDAQMRELADSAAEEVSMTGRIEELEESLREATTAQEEAEELVAELILAYSDVIDAARSTLAQEASDFACSFGTSQATDGRPLSSVTGQAVLGAFTSSDTFLRLKEDPEIETLLSMSKTLDEDFYGVDTDEFEATAAECWQVEDARVNAALYVHQDTLRDAVLEAACIHGVTDELYEDRDSGSYWFTGTLQEWFLNTGFEQAGEYIESVRRRFGSLKDFLAIPDSEVQSESDQCEEIRELISPKGERTWNVGDEILPGTWMGTPR